MATANRSGKPWTPEDIAYLRQGYGQMTIAKIAGKLGRTCDSTRKKACTLGIANAGPPDPQWADINWRCQSPRCDTPGATVSGMLPSDAITEWRALWDSIHGKCKAGA